jgi:hypothetical protein
LRSVERLPKVGQVVQHRLDLRPHLFVEVILYMRDRAAKVPSNHQAGVFELSKILRQHLLRRGSEFTSELTEPDWTGTNRT